MRKSDIGRAGERIFEKWGRSAGFLTPEPTPDDIGVDRLFEIPAQLSGVGLDTGPPAAHGWVQIKTSGRRRLTEPVKLDICRRFVFADTPAFFLRIVIDADETPLEAYVAHVDAKLGAAILEALRRLDAEKADAAAHLHREQFTVRWTREDGVEPSGEAVMQRLAELIGDPATYAARKKEWRDTVGYGETPAVIQISANAEALARHLLGESDHVDTTIVRATSQRFDIERPIHGLAGPERKMRLGVHAGTRCVLRLALGRQQIDIPGRFWTALLAMRDPPPGVDAWRFEGGLLEIRGGAERVTLRAGLIDGRRATLGEWRASGEACTALCAGSTCTLSVAFGERMARLGLGRIDGGVEGLSAIGRHATVAAAFAAEVEIAEGIELAAEQLDLGHENRASFLELGPDREVQVELPLPTSTLRQLPKGTPSVMTATVWAMLGEWHALRVVQTAPAPWSATRSRLTFSAHIARCGPTHLERGTEQALARARALASAAHEEDWGPGVVHLVCTDHPQLARMGGGPDGT